MRIGGEEGSRSDLVSPQEIKVLIRQHGLMSKNKHTIVSRKSDSILKASYHVKTQ